MWYKKTVIDQHKKPHWAFGPELSIDRLKDNGNFFCGQISAWYNSIDEEAKKKHYNFEKHIHRFGQILSPEIPCVLRPSLMLHTLKTTRLNRHLVHVTNCLCPVLIPIKMCGPSWRWESDTSLRLLYKKEGFICPINEASSALISNRPEGLLNFLRQVTALSINI